MARPENASPRQAASAANLRRLLEASAIVASHRFDDPRVQDAYSLRCAPQVLGAARDALAHAERTAAAIMVFLAFLIVMNALAIYFRRKFERKW